MKYKSKSRVNFLIRNFIFKYFQIDLENLLNKCKLNYVIY